MIRARFYVAKIEKAAHAPAAAAVTLQAVSRGDQNATWASATPSGTIAMQVNNPRAAEWFEGMLGKDMELSFAPAPVAEAADGHPFRAADVPANHYMNGACGDCGQRHADQA